VDIHELLQIHEIHDSDSYADHSFTCTAVPGIPIRRGLRCPVTGCSHGRESLANMRKHVREKHQSSFTKDQVIVCHVQTFFESNQTRYPIMLPSSTIPARAQPSAIAHVEAIYQKIFDAPAQLDDRAHLNPFLATYSWVDITSRYEARRIQDWVSYPGKNELLSRLGSAVQEYYAPIMAEMRKVEQHTTTLRWIKSPKK
jgi:Orsellinic acid/F9775 biosynthesis cluster protein D